MNKKRSLSFIYLFVIVFFTASCAGSKKADSLKHVAASYSGSEKWDITMTLYTDSTYTYTIVPDMMGFKSVSRGAYLKNDSLMVLFKNKKTLLKATTYTKLVRIRGDDLLMYSEAQENSKDSNFIKAYYTLSLDK